MLSAAGSMDKRRRNRSKGEGTVDRNASGSWSEKDNDGSRDVSDRGVLSSMQTLAQERQN